MNKIAIHTHVIFRPRNVMFSLITGYFCNYGTVVSIYIKYINLIKIFTPVHVYSSILKHYI